MVRGIDTEDRAVLSKIVVGFTTVALLLLGLAGVAGLAVRLFQVAAG